MSSEPGCECGGGERVEVFRDDAALIMPVYVGHGDNDVTDEARGLVGLDVPLLVVKGRHNVVVCLWPESVPWLSGTQALLVARVSHAAWVTGEWVELVRGVIAAHAERRVGAPIALRYGSTWVPASWFYDARARAEGQ